MHKKSQRPVPTHPSILIYAEPANIGIGMELNSKYYTLQNIFHTVVTHPIPTPTTYLVCSKSPPVNHSILLPGDIEKIVEYRLASLLGKELRSNILIVPHHGSQSSSTPEFISQVQPRFALFSAGYRNQFRHPHPDIVARYQHHEIRTFNTAEVGAITFRLTPNHL